MRKRIKEIGRVSIPNWLAALLGGVFVFRIPSFFEPFFYGDELIYLDLGEAVRRGMVLYRDAHDNKPPLLYYLAAIAGDIFWFRVILAFWMLATIVLFWYFAKTLIKRPPIVAASTCVFAILTSLPFFEGQVANAELFMIGPIIAAFLVGLQKKNIVRNSILAGMLFSIATLFKVPSAFDAAALIGMWMIAARFSKASIGTLIKRIVAFVIGFTIPLLGTCIWFAAKGALSEYIIAAFLQNFGYVSSWREGGVSDVPFLVKNGPLLMRAGLVIIAFIATWLFRKKRSAVFLLSCLWLATSLFAATLSERPYPHYLVQSIPAFSLLLGLLFLDETIEQSLTIIPLTFAFIVPVYFQYWQYSTSLYAGRFLTLVQEGRGDSYFNKFGATISRNYKISEFLKGSVPEGDRAFVWGDSSGIYALARRLPPIKYVADYHIRDFSSQEETIKALEKTRPKVIVILPEAPEFPALFNLVRKQYIQLESIENATIWYNTSQ